jgi:Mycothiol maleylpyruvate isomerase N-terminal domain
VHPGIALSGVCFAERVNLDALRIAYGELAALAVSLDEAASWRPTACAGWAVRDLVYHLLGDAQRALVALATPAAGPADRNAVTYWMSSPGAPDAESRGIRASRTMASQWRLDFLTGTYAETAAAVLTLAGRADSGDLVATQGHVLSVDDLLATLVVEATIHHLDLIVELDRDGPRSEPVAVTRATLDTLLGRATPAAWNSEQWVRAATGRAELTDEQRRFLGPDVDRLPLLR